MYPECFSWIVLSKKFKIESKHKTFELANLSSQVFKNVIVKET